MTIINLNCNQMKNPPTTFLEKMVGGQLSVVIKSCNQDACM